MYIILVIGAVIFGLALLVTIYGFTKPRMASMFRSVDIKTTPETVYPYLVNLKTFVEKWSPWTEKDLEAVITYGDKEEGVGAVYKWKGHPKKVGFGVMEIVEVENLKRVKSILNFGGRGDANVETSIETIDGDNIRVTWRFESDSHFNPMARIFGAMMDRFLGPDFESGLNKLKNELEK